MGRRVAIKEKDLGPFADSLNKRSIHKAGYSNVIIDSEFCESILKAHSPIQVREGVVLAMPSN